MKTSVTCLIPFYNEGPRLVETLRQVTQVKSINKIICINDGSSDNSVALLDKHFPNIRLIRLKPNKGKTEAIRQSLQSVNTSHTLLLDADLLHLANSELQNAISLAFNKPEIDMIILQRINEPLLVKIFRFDTILSGQRIIKTSYLKELLSKNIKHYDLEVAMNEYAKNHKLHILRFPITAVNSRRIDKWGWKRSFFSNISMFKRFVEYPGLPKLLNQILYFARN